MLMTIDACPVISCVSDHLWQEDSHECLVAKTVLQQIVDETINF